MGRTKHLCLTLAVVAAAAGQSKIDLGRQAKNIDFSGAASTKPFRMGTALPGTCSQGEAFFKVDAEPGRNWYACTAVNVWTLQTGSGVTELSGDVTGAAAATRVEAVQGRPVANTDPADGQVLRWNAGAARWEPQASDTSGAANVSYAFSGLTVVSIPGATHGLATANLIVDCYDNASPNLRLEPTAVRVAPGTFDVTVEFASARTGRCVINGTGGGVSAIASNTFAGGTVQTFLGALVAAASERTAPAKTGTSLPGTCTPGDQFFKTDASPGQNLYFCTAANTWTPMRGGDVSSVFGRTGAVTPAAGDYNFSQIAGTVASAQIAAGVDAAKVGAGTVTNTAFGYLANATSNVQAQLNDKAAASHSHTLGGDLSGDAASATVARLQGRAVANTAPADGQALVWSGGAGMWQPGAAGGGGGAGMAAQLGDFAVVRSSPTLLTIGAGCTDATPCNARFGNVTYHFTRSCTATLASGSGAAYVYVASGGTLTVGHNLSLSVSAGCMAQPSVTSFPHDAIPLSTWTATGGAWDSSGGVDRRAFLSLKAISAGLGIITVESGGRTTVGVDSTTVPTFLSATATINFPAIASGTCSADQVMALTGAVTGDAVAPGWPAGLEGGLTGTMRVSASNSIAIRLCNVSGSTIDPASATFRATIVRSF